jgi:hypothetical protein
MQTQRFTEFSLYLAHRPGELAGVLEAAAAAQVQIFGLCVTEYKDRGLVRLVGDPEDALRHLCESLVEAGVGPVVESTVLAFEKRPGALRDVCVGLADARVNIQHVFLTAPFGDTPSRVIMRVDDVNAAADAIAKLDWPDHLAG